MPTPEAVKSNPEAFHSLQNPDMDAGIFKAYIAGPQGFEIKTNESLFRRSPFDLKGPQNDRIKVSTGLSFEDKDLLADRMSDPVDGELKFTKGLDAQQVLEKLRTEKQKSQSDPERVKALEEEFASAQHAYIDRNAPKVALRNIRRTVTPQGDQLTFDIKPVSFPVSKNFAKPGASPEKLNLAESAATAMVLITSDNKILITHRSINNEVYPDMIGTSIAGAFDGTFDRDSKQKGKLKPITEQDVLKNIRKEAKEELGIDDQHLGEADITLVGLAEETQPYLHHEFLYLGKTKYTSAEIRKNASETERARKNNLSIHDIESKFDFIDATPEAIFTLLTKVASPIPKTHQANLAVVGYKLAYARDGKQSAEEWKKKTEAGIIANNLVIDNIVEKAYSAKPDLLKSIPQRFIKKIDDAVNKFKEANPQASESEIETYRQKRVSYLPKRDPKGYSFELTPGEQGLPGYNEAMKESGLITKD